MADSAPMNVLVIDDDPDTRANLRDILELDGYQVEEAGSAAEALARDDWDRVAAVLLDRRLPDGSAEQLLPRLRQLAPDAAVLIVTGYTDLEGAITAIRQGAADYLTKPISPDLIRTRLASVAERRRAEHEIVRLNKDLQQRLNELQALLEVIPVGIAIAADPACRRVRVNPALTRLLRLTAVAGTALDGPPGEQPGYEVRHNGRGLPPGQLPLRLAAGGAEVHEMELDVRLPSGETLAVLSYAAPLFDERGRPRGAVGAFLDITERKRAQERALQAERLAAIGQMVAGLAHESGNALARIQSCLEMLAFEVEGRPEALGLIDRIQKAQDNLRQLHDEVRGYAAPLRLEREPWDLAAVWRQAWENLAPARQGRDAVLAEDAAGVALTVPVDPFRVEQVFRNVFENALAACRDPARLTVRCRGAELDGWPAVEVSVRDNGPGLGAEQRRRIFEPFYTTKTKGTGLGMAIVKRIVEAHGGRITVGPGADGGAEIVITLPREQS